MQNTFILNDENITNSYGFKVFNAGGRFERFNENPVMLLYHNHEKVAGKWQNLTIHNNKIVATPEFDEGDPLAMDAKRKVEKGYLKGASLGIIPLKWQYAENADGTTETRLIEWELLEASICSIPSNRAALKLYHTDTLEEITETELKLFIENSRNKTNTNEMNKDTIILNAETANALSIGTQADTRELNAAVMELHAAKEKAEKELNTYKLNAAQSLIDTAINEKRLTADKRESFINLALNDYKQAADIIGSLPKATTLNTQIQESDKSDLTGLQADRQNWTYKDWQTKDMQGLKKLQTEQAQVYQKLHDTHVQNLINQ